MAYVAESNNAWRSMPWTAEQPIQRNIGKNTSTLATPAQKVLQCTEKKISSAEKR